MNWIYLTLAILFEVIATSALKSSENFTRLYPSILVVIGYGAAFLLLSLALRSIPLGIAYAIWSGAGIILVAASGWFLYHQKLDTPAVLGISLILIGVLIIQVFSKSAGH